MRMDGGGGGAPDAAGDTDGFRKYAELRGARLCLSPMVSVA